MFPQQDMQGPAQDGSRSLHENPEGDRRVLYSAESCHAMLSNRSSYAIKLHRNEASLGRSPVLCCNKLEPDIVVAPKLECQDDTDDACAAHKAISKAAAKHWTGA